MKVLYKTVMFLTLLIFCVGSVCATEPNNTTIKGDNTVNLTDNQITINEVNSIINKALEKKDVEIKALQDNDIKQSMEIQQLKDNNTQLDKRIKALEESNKQLVDSNKQKDIDIKELKDSNKQKDIDIKELKDSNKVLNDKVDNQSVIINELNNKLELQFNEIKGLQTDKDKLNAEINKLKDEKCSIYEKLLESPKKEDYEQLKAEINNKDKQIEELNTQIDKLNNEIKTLKAINSISRNDVVNSLKALSSTNIQNIKCGQYTFKLNDYLKIPLIKNGKNDIIKFKKDNGRLPKYVMIAGYKVPQKVYKKIYNL